MCIRDRGKIDAEPPTCVIEASRNPPVELSEAIAAARQTDLQPISKKRPAAAKASVQKKPAVARKRPAQDHSGSE
eukprot:1011021-Alexandrium_andersonii.AAC.1